MSDQGVIFPQSLDIDTWGQLWVGCDTFKGKSDAKVHIINNNFPTTVICQFECNILHYSQYNVIVISHMDSSCY
jgi:hypothetical protein